MPHGSALQRQLQSAQSSKLVSPIAFFAFFAGGLSPVIHLRALCAAKQPFT